MTKWTSEFLFSFVASPIKTFIFRENVISTFSALGLICELHFHCQNGLCLCIMTHYGLFKSINIFISFRKQHLVSTKTFWMPFLLKLFCRMCILFLQYSVFCDSYVENMLCTFTFLINNFSSEIFCLSCLNLNTAWGKKRLQ